MNAPLRSTAAPYSGSKLEPYRDRVAGLRPIDTCAKVNPDWSATDDRRERMGDMPCCRSFPLRVRSGWGGGEV